LRIEGLTAVRVLRAGLDAGHEAFLVGDQSARINLACTHIRPPTPPPGRRRGRSVAGGTDPRKRALRWDSPGCSPTFISKPSASRSRCWRSVSSP
jgi:hypothetical protein